MESRAGIYIHIPFCVKKCNYCDFLSAPAGETERTRYVEVLVREMIQSEQQFPEVRKIDSVFLGGGTPGILTDSQIETIFEALHQRFSFDCNSEVTIECNPGTLDRDKFSAYIKAGINRISFGVQSANDKELEVLGRIHTFSDAVNSYCAARDAGFQNINIDLMSGIPGQSITSYEQTLKEIFRLDPDHISAYSLIIEEGTPFYDTYREKPPVDEETDRDMYRMTGMQLSEHGYHRYEISNYAKKGMECRHNLKYWSGTDYIGFGLGASSKVANVRYRNEENMMRYMECVRDNRPVAKPEEILTQKDEMVEYFILGLRKTRGISLHEFETMFGVKADMVYGKQIRMLLEQGLLVQKDDMLALTEYGLDVSNLVFQEFIG